MLVGAFVAVLIGYVVVRFRRRDDRLPRQVRENIPMELAYTAIPFLIVVGLFSVTFVSVRGLDKVDDDPDVVVEVTGFQWGWRFHYPDTGVTVATATVRPDPRAAGRGEGALRRHLQRRHPLVLDPRVPLQARRLPRPDTSFQVDVDDRTGVYENVGVCAEFCGLEHQAMRFSVGDRAARPVRRGGAADERVEEFAQPLARRRRARRARRRRAPDEHAGLPRTLLGWLTTTDHKAIGVAYAVTAGVFLLIGGALAGIIRAELAEPGMQIVDEQTYNSVFTIHGSVMVFLFAVPFGFALANYLIPLQIGAPDLAFPRLNALSYWLYLFGGVIMLLGFLTDGGAAAFGWTAYPPLSGPTGSPGLGADMWIVAIILTGTSGTLGAVNIITTVTMLRAPGMTMFRMPILTWNLFLTSTMVLVAFPVLTGALIMLESDRRFGTHFYDPTDGGSPILFQHLFWFFGHPEVYIVALPFFGVVTEIFPVFSRRPIFGYRGLILASLAITALSTSVWAHHMFVTGQVVLPFFAATSLLIAVPTGVKVFNWIGTMWGGSLRFDPPMLFALGFLVTFVAGGLTGVMLASPTLDFQLSDTYFVVAHFHYVMGGTVVFALFAGDPLLVAQGDRADAVGAAGPVALLAAVRRVQHDVLRDAHPRPPRHAAAGR